MRINDNVRIEKDEHYVILINIYNGFWHRLTFEVYEAIKLLVSANISQKEFIEEWVDPTDREYLKKTIEYLKKIEILEETKKIVLPSNIGFAITHRCNLSCKHCSYNAGNISESEKLDDEDIVRVLYKIIDFAPNSISITGGEPLVRKNFIEIMGILNKVDYIHKNLMTNALLININNVSGIVETFDSFDISLDGVDDKTCGLIRGNGIFERVIDSTKLLIAHGVDPKRISLSMVLSSENEKQINTFYQINDELGTNPVTRSYAFLGRGAVNNDLFKIDIDEISSINPDLKDFSAMNCGVAQSEIYIDCDGNIYPCPMIIDDSFSMGNVLKLFSLKDFFTKGEQFKSNGYQSFINKYMPEKYAPCCKCKNKYFCVKCPVQHFQYINSEIKTRFCYIKNKMCNIIWE
jgi:radical SAM protein with 4Fe4S-binding SPASM domain